MQSPVLTDEAFQIWLALSLRENHKGGNIDREDLASDCEPVLPELASLRNSGLIADRREGIWMYYRLFEQFQIVEKQEGAEAEVFAEFEKVRDAIDAWLRDFFDGMETEL